MFRILAAMAPSTASSRSASSNTMNGAFPPSSMEVRRTFCAASAMRRLPTGVEPVKETFRSRGVREQRPGDPGGADEEDDDVEDAGGQAGVEHGLGEVLRGQRGEFGGFEDHGAAGGDGGGDLAGGHRQREVPRRDEQAGSDGFVLDEDLVLALGGGEVAAVVADGFLGEPAQELGAVGDFAAGFGQRLAHFQGHQQREVLGPFGDQVKGPAQDLGPHPRCGPRPGRLGGVGGVERGDGVLAGGGGEGGEYLPGGGVVHVERAAVGRVPPLPADQQAGGNGGEERGLTFGRDGSREMAAGCTAKWSCRSLWE